MNTQLFLPLLIVLLAVPLFLQVRKQKKAMQDQQKLQNSLSAGDRVMTTSGLFGTVVSTSEKSVELEIAPGVETTWLSAAIREKVDTEEDAADEQDESAEAESAEEPQAEETKAEQESTEKASEAKTTESSTESAEATEKQKTS